MRAAELQDLALERPTAVSVGGEDLVLVRLGDEVFALRNQCSHAGSRLERGRAISGTLICPMHGARFDLKSGRCVNAPYVAVETFQTRVRDGIVEVAIEAGSGESPATSGA